MELSKTDTAAIKGIAIILMLWHHLFLNTMAYGNLTNSLAVVFKVCVALFLFVSGYGLTKQYSQLDKPYFKNTLKFLLRRYVNFFLPYWFCFVLVVVVGNICGYSFSEAYPSSRNTLKCVLLDIAGQMGYNSYLNPWWFNKMIIQLYLVFPILFLIICNKYLSWVGLALIIVAQLYAKNILGHVFFIVEGGLPAFYLGMLCARCRLVPEANDGKWRPLLFFEGLFVCIGLAVLHLMVVKDPYVAVLIRALMALCIIGVYKSFGNQQTFALEFVGKYATFMYLIHMLFIKLIPGVIYGVKYSVLVFMLFVAVCLVAAMLIDALEKLSRYDRLRVGVVKLIDKW
jgi:peptidoglycan/LPS O-acetylase OafA/YrhL